MDAINILLVEDEPLLRLDFEDALTQAGFTVTAVATIAAAEVTLASRSDWRGLVTDIRLEKGRSGWSLARVARQTYPDLAIVYISGDSAGEWSAEGVPHSVMISKPFAISQLITGVSHLLNSGETSHSS